MTLIFGKTLLPKQVKYEAGILQIIVEIPLAVIILHSLFFLYFYVFSDYIVLFLYN